MSLTGHARSFALAVAATLIAPLLFASATAHAKTKSKTKTNTNTNTKTKTHGGKSRTNKHQAAGHAAEGAGWLFKRPANVVPNQHGKVVLFPFRNDDEERLSTQVGQLLEARGLDVVTGVRRVDTSEQYRDVATQLDLVAYVDGDVRGNDAKTKATIRLRSGYSGRSVSQVTFTDSRSNLPRTISDTLWKKMGAAMARTCADAEKPRRRGRNTLEIEAGTPLDGGAARPQASKADDVD
jgi:hypothetical protein